MSLHLLFKSYTITRTAEEERQKCTWYSNVSRAELEEFIKSSFPLYESSSHGEAQSYRYYQEPILWHCDVEFLTSFNPDGTTRQRPPKMPQNHKLSSLNVPVKLNTLWNYLTNWDNYLYGRVKVTSMSEGEAVTLPATPAVPEEWATMTTDEDFTSTNGTRYRWAKSKSEVSRDPDKYGNLWLQVKQPEKKGVTQRDNFTYQIIEYGKYKTEEDATWVTDNMLNSIRIRPLLGNMGVRRAGDWKCDRADVYHDGKSWIAELNWTMSGDAAGWDVDMYAMN